MLDLFFAGGPVFMALLALLGLAALILALKKAKDVTDESRHESAQTAQINLVLHLGIFSFFLGILAQAISLMQAFQAIEQVEDA